MTNSKNPQLRKRAFEGKPFTPQVGVMCLIDVDGVFRPFLPCLIISDQAIRGWAFIDPSHDQYSNFLRQRGFQADARRQPCYCEVAHTALRPLGGA